ncbi:MAG: response regulator transcription factor [Flavobacteriaceae bacterium]|nr:response regulator transcription factor [Flavobacteriaceae bacterium]
MNIPQKIVIAEDNSVFLMLIKLKLEQQGYQLFIAQDGKKALELIEEHKPDLILTDIMMDYVNGLEVISHVRNVLKYITPIIVFSASGQEEMVLKAFNLGANDFLGKPLSPSELIVRVKRMLL